MVPSTSAARCADTRTRLARLLGMMGSQHDGEALNAARLADKLVREQGITWFDVISTAPPRASPDPPPPPRPSDDDLLMQFESASDACEFVLASTSATQGRSGTISSYNAFRSHRIRVSLERRSLRPKGHALVVLVLRSAAYPWSAKDVEIVNARRGRSSSRRPPSPSGRTSPSSHRSADRPRW